MDQNRDIYVDAKSDLPSTPKKLHVVQSTTVKVQKSKLAMIVHNQAIVKTISKKTTSLEKQTKLAKNETRRKVHSILGGNSSAAKEELTMHANLTQSEDLLSTTDKVNEQDTAGN
jgi:hypothetical protein